MEKEAKFREKPGEAESGKEGEADAYAAIDVGIAYGRLYIQAEGE